MLPVARTVTDSDLDTVADQDDPENANSCVPAVFVAACGQDTDLDGVTDFLEGEFVDFLEKHIAVTGESYIPTVVDSLISKGKTSCRAIPTSSSWFGVTYADDKEHVVLAIRDLIDPGEYPYSLED